MENKIKKGFALVILGSEFLPEDYLDHITARLKERTEEFNRIHVIQFDTASEAIKNKKEFYNNKGSVINLMYLSNHKRKEINQ